MKAGLPERYFASLEMPYLWPDGKFRQPASQPYIDRLRQLHAGYKPKFDLRACLADQGDFNGNVWFWSDQHFFHKNIIGYCDRPFNSVYQMNDAMLRNCLSRVQADDIVVFGGDITMTEVDATNAMLRTIPGYKILVLGNHDCHRGELLKLAVDEIAACLEIEFEGRSVFVSHYALSEIHLGLRQVNLHGHLHQNPLPVALGTGDRHFNMCVENTGYAPMLLKDLLGK